MKFEKVNEYAKELVGELGFDNFIQLDFIPNTHQPHKKRFLLSTNKGKYFLKFFEPPIREDVGFLQHLNRINFPTQKIYLPMTPSPIEGQECAVYSYVGGDVKNTVSSKENIAVAEIIGRLHNESDNYLEQERTSRGLTHGDLKLQNFVFIGSMPHVIDFEKMKDRSYVADVSGYLFYNILSDLTEGILTQEDARGRTNLFICTYNSKRGINLNRDEFNQYSKRHHDWFVSWINNQKKLNPSLEKKRKFTDKTLEVLLL